MSTAMRALSVAGLTWVAAACGGGMIRQPGVELAPRPLSCQPVVLDRPAAPSADTSLVFPGILEREAMLAGNPLATYTAMRERENDYLASPTFAGIYPEVRLNLEQFLGFPCAGVQAMSLLDARGASDSADVSILDAYRPRPALEVLRERAAATQIVIWAEEHHLPQTRSLYESMLRELWDLGYRYLAAEAFEDTDMTAFTAPDYAGGYYLRDPVFASAVRVAQELGYRLVSYDTREGGPASEPSFRDATQARNIVERIFARDPAARVLVLAGRGHASEVQAQDGWTPMAHVLKQLTGIDPLTLYTPTMTERLRAQQEDALFREAVRRGWVREPVVLQRRDASTLLGTPAFDAYVFFPRTRLVGGRPDWLFTTLRRRPVPLPDAVRGGTGLRLVQAFRSDWTARQVPQDQIVLGAGEDATVLMLPPGAYSIRSVNSAGRVLGRAEIRVR